MFRVFVSYSTRDLENVATLRQALVGTGVEVFVAEHSVEPSQSLSHTIARAIEACDLFVLIWSKNAKASDWVSQEIGKAHSLKKRILPLVLTDGLTLPGFIGDLKYLPVYKDPEASLNWAREFILRQFEAKQAVLAAAQQQKQNETLAVLGLGALLLWALGQK